MGGVSRHSAYLREMVIFGVFRYGPPYRKSPNFEETLTFSEWDETWRVHGSAPPGVRDQVSSPRVTAFARGGHFWDFVLSARICHFSGNLEKWRYGQTGSFRWRKLGL